MLFTHIFWHASVHSDTRAHTNMHAARTCVLTCWLYWKLGISVIHFTTIFWHGSVHSRVHTHIHAHTWTHVLTSWLYCWWIGYRTCLASRQHGNTTDAQSERSIWTTTSFAAVTWQIVKIIQVIYRYEHVARKLNWGYTKIMVVNFHISSWIHLVMMLITCVCPFSSLSSVPLCFGCLGHKSHDQGF